MKIYIKCDSLKGNIGVAGAAIDEAINKITNIELELVTRKEISQTDIDNAIGKPITFFVEDIIDNMFHKVRWDGKIFYFSDITGGEADNGVYYYSVAMNPTLWSLNYSVNTRSFANKSRIQVIDELLQSHEFVDGVTYKKSYFKDSVYTVFNQLIQTGNSDLSFLQSLLANAGINYFFGCDKDGEKHDVLYLIDNPAFFPTVEGEIPILGAGGMVRQPGGNSQPLEKFQTTITGGGSAPIEKFHTTIMGGGGATGNSSSIPKFQTTIVPRYRHIESIVKMTKAAPTRVNTTVIMGDGSIRGTVISKGIDKSGTKGVVNLIIPEGNNDPETVAKQISTATSEGFTAERTVYRGISDHVRIRPGYRIQVRNIKTDAHYKILVRSAYHMFRQSVLEALSETGGGDIFYENHFAAVESLAPIRSTNKLIDVNDQVSANTSMNIVPSSASVLKQLARRAPRARFNSKADPEINTDAISDLMAVVLIQQEHIKSLTTQVAALQAAISANSSGLIAAEITKDAWVTEGYELVCMVKSAAFQEPIVVKVAASWHDRGGGMLNLPRQGNHVWIQQVYGSKGNDWVLVGYRPTSAVSSSNNPAKSFKIKALQ